MLGILQNAIAPESQSKQAPNLHRAQTSFFEKILFCQLPQDKKFIILRMKNELKV